MGKYFIAPEVVLVALLLWWFVATLLMRLFGIQLPLQPLGRDRKYAFQRLTYFQSVCAGVLLQGCGMFIAMTLFEYVAWKYWNSPSRDFSLRIRVSNRAQDEGEGMADTYSRRVKSYLLEGSELWSNPYGTGALVLKS